MWFPPTGEAAKAALKARGAGKPCCHLHFAPTKFHATGALDAGGKSQIWGLFSAPAASCSVSLDTSSTFCPEKTHSCSQTAPCRLGLSAFAQAGPLFAILFRPLPPREIQPKCAVTPSHPFPVTVTVSSRHLGFLAVPKVSILLSVPQPPVFQSRSALHTLDCELKGSVCVEFPHGSLAHGRCHRIFVE